MHSILKSKNETKKFIFYFQMNHIKE